MFTYLRLKQQLLYIYRNIDSRCDTIYWLVCRYPYSLSVNGVYLNIPPHFNRKTGD
jgi:hypothetical protein